VCPPEAKAGASSRNRYAKAGATALSPPVAASQRSSGALCAPEASDSGGVRVYRAVEELQADLDERMRHYNEARTHQGRWCFGKTPMQTFLDSRTLAREKQQIGEAA
jgi:hypothetical protein